MTRARTLSGAGSLVGAVLMLTAGTAEPGRAGSPQYREADDKGLMIEPFALTVGQIDHMEVVTSTGEPVGRVDGVIMDSSGRIVAIRVESGGKEALIHLHEFRVDGSRLISSITGADIQTLGASDPPDDVDADGDDSDDPSLQRSAAPTM
jgi:sporulation protein YlmC with PRC-barrel domain